MAIEQAFRAEPAWMSEFDPLPARVLDHRWPGVPNLGDVTSVDWASIEPVDLICGGSLCQDVSAAGKRAGMVEGTRSNLWAEMREAIATIQPMFVVWENVRGALSAYAKSEVESEPGLLGGTWGPGRPALRAAGRVLGDLAELGYDSEWTGIRASDVGACHQRVRVFVLAWRRDVADTEGWRRRLRTAANFGPAGREIDAPGDADRVRPAVNLLRTVMADEDGGGALHPDVAAARGQTLRLTGQVLALTGDLLPSPVAQPSHNSPEAHLRKKPGRQVVTDLAIIVENGILKTGGMLPTPRAHDYMASMVAPAAKRHVDAGNGSLAEVIGVRLPTPRATRGGSSTETVQKLPTPRVSDANGVGAHGYGGPDLRTAVDSAGVSNLDEAAQWGRYAPAITQHERVLGRPAPAPTAPSKTGRPQLSACFTEWMMMWPEGHVTAPEIWAESGLSDAGIRNAQIKACGNGVVTPQAVAALRLLAARALSGEEIAA